MTETDFKVGDEVEILATDWAGMTGTVTVVDRVKNLGSVWDIEVHLDDKEGIFHKHELKLVKPEPKAEAVKHPAHYGGGDNPYEAIKVIEAWGLGFNLGNAAKYLARAGKKGNKVEDLNKLIQYVQFEIAKEEAK